MWNAAFILVLATGFALLLWWSFRTLPNEGWQILASIPVSKDESGRWRGLNLTYYGVFNALAYGTGVAMAIVLLAAIAIPFRGMLTVLSTILLLCVPASKWIAQIVEKKRHTFTVGGASFVGVVAAPWIISLLNHAASGAIRCEIPVIPTLAALSICYALGEGTGRLACISFGCCYGKPLSQCGPLVQKLFGGRGFVFRGETKKIAYAGKMAGEPVVPVQAITSILYIGTGLLGIALYLQAQFTIAFILTILVTQIWRPLSELLRADYRGGGKLSAYQIMGILMVVYALFVPLLFPTASDITPDLAAGLEAIWDPIPMLFLQALMIGIFLFTGRSMVTGSTVSFHVFRDRI